MRNRNLRGRHPRGACGQAGAARSVPPSLAPETTPPSSGAPAKFASQFPTPSAVRRTNDIALASAERERRGEPASVGSFLGQPLVPTATGLRCTLGQSAAVDLAPGAQAVADVLTIPATIGAFSVIGYLLHGGVLRNPARDSTPTLAPQ